jgi:hypothetical protein
VTFLQKKLFYQKTSKKCEYFITLSQQQFVITIIRVYTDFKFPNSMTFPRFFNVFFQKNLFVSKKLPKKTKNREILTQSMLLIFKKNHVNMTPTIQSAYESFFWIKFKCPTVPWVPQFCCRSCARNVSFWLNAKRALNFSTPMIWREYLEDAREPKLFEQADFSWSC